jgi:hypothetical protein
MRNALRTLIASILILAMCTLFTSGCGKEEGAIEKLGKSADKALKESQKSLESAAEKTKEAAEDITE